jgi:hypothetical protein
VLDKGRWVSSVRDRFIPCVLGFGCSDSHRLRGWYRRILLSGTNKRRRRRLLTTAAFWPVATIRQAVRAVRLHGRAVAEGPGPGRLRQFIQQVGCGIRFGIDAEAYYRYRWFLADRRRNGAHYVPSRRMNRLLLALALREAPGDATMLDNKDRFFSWCREHGLSTVPVLAIFFDGALEIRAAGRGNELPQVDLFVKPSDSRWGFGAQVWPYTDGGFADRDGTILSSAELLARLADESRHVGFGKAASVTRAQQSRILLQERLRNHPVIADLSVEALCTVRLVTARTPSGDVEAIAAAFRMATVPGPVDNVSAGGIVADVDLRSGQLSHAVSLSTQHCTLVYDHHPHTGARIVGRVIPCWPEALALAVTAHDFTETISFVGWDIAICQGGPVLVEANVSWGGDLMQIASGIPLGATPFTRWYLTYMEGAWRRQRRAKDTTAKRPGRKPTAVSPGKPPGTVEDR